MEGGPGALRTLKTLGSFRWLLSPKSCPLPSPHRPWSFTYVHYLCCVPCHSLHSLLALFPNTAGPLSPLIVGIVPQHRWPVQSKCCCCGHHDPPFSLSYLASSPTSTMLSLSDFSYHSHHSTMIEQRTYIS